MTTVCNCNIFILYIGNPILTCACDYLFILKFVTVNLTVWHVHVTVTPLLYICYTVFMT